MHRSIIVMIVICFDLCKLATMIPEGWYPPQGWIHRLWKVGALYVGHHDWPTKKILGFRWSKKAKITLETNVFGETFPSVFSNFLLFNESLRMKSYQFFKIYIHFYKKRETTLMQQSMRKEKKRKFEPCFI